ncbi:MAG: tripartite tricarboxylate transporter substrate-binding protein, partial [Pseudomonadota bacterium]|nr:tripartite tricarboxylate transporter substrate-binding protein [Pseudomonadota bacterium]
MSRLFAIALSMLLPLAAAAQSYPSKAIRLICPFPPGGAVDIASRAISAELTKVLGQPVAVENKPGAGGNLGGAEAARAAPDGYTLFQAVVNNAINDALAPDACCVLNDKLVPVTRLYTTPLVMVVHPGVPAATLQEYVA